MAENVDLEALVHLEQTFYDVGYTDGYAHGRIHGLVEGRALGREKGFEIWEEIGFYQGFARTWLAIQAQRDVQRQDQRAVHHITHLRDLIRQFPTVNPSSSSSASASSSHSCHGASSSPSENEAGTQPESNTETEVDLSTLQRQIRSRYKALCASLGVRPTLRASVSAGNEDGDAAGVSGTGDDPQKRQVWTLEGDVRRSTVQGLSF